ncbi:hypothetical protein [Legionella quateirensis]|uniref:LegC5 n=1 Tax=Legionella quateirensis TaxID=45072 RepID=A0A378KQP0_9GAMM|nr:hypothetical protein [Legionella quateirensis]KTD54694.1 LegC5 [Legionella quateirensis]STY16872.1 substrate of the Dot/Icm secretion system [Legionella quateirensis]
MASGEILISEITLKKIKEYHQYLCTQGIDEAGAYLKQQLETSLLPIEEMDLVTFTQFIIQSKIPKIFAESGVYHDKRDWTLQEESILGDIGIHMPVSFFNDGGHYSSFNNHTPPISGNLAYIPGALLRSDLSNTSADLQEVIVDGHFNQQRFNELYERRLLPLLLNINSQAKNEGKLAAITVPGIGTGQFAGQYGDIIKEAFRTALEYVLEKNEAQLTQIDIIHYDPYSGDEAQAKNIGHIDYRVSPSSIEETTGQLEYPKGSSASTHTLTSFVAWDQFSWPGNDFWPGSRATDDGVKAASTDTMAVITGVKGVYNPKNGSYEPPQSYSNWQALAKAKNINFSAAVYVVSNDGQKIALMPEPRTEKQQKMEDQNPLENLGVAPRQNVPDLQQKIDTKPEQFVDEPKHQEQTYQGRAEQLDRVLDNFAAKINTIGSYHPEAKDKALELLNTLKNAKSEAFSNPSQESVATFRTKAISAIKEATPVLQRDLGWGDYLVNLTKMIVNAVTSTVAQVFTFGYSNHQGFFTIKQSDANKDAQKLETDLGNSFN